jgi:hypothetical protein
MITAIVSIVLILLSLFSFSIFEYSRRPAFAGTFMMIGWGPSIVVPIDANAEAFVDRWDDVILVTPMISDGGYGKLLEWMPVKRIDDKLLVRHIETGVVQELDWRRDCLVILDDDGRPTYKSIPSDISKNAVKCENWSKKIRQIITDGD